MAYATRSRVHPVPVISLVSAANSLGHNSDTRASSRGYVRYGIPHYYHACKTNKEIFRQRIAHKKRTSPNGEHQQLQKERNSKGPIIQPKSISFYKLLQKTSLCSLTNYTLQNQTANR